MIGDVEQAIIDRIAEASKQDVLGYKIPTVTSYGGEFSGSEKNIYNVVRRLPAVWVVFNGAGIIREFGNTTEIEAKYNIIVAAKSLRNEEKGRRATGSKPGSYQIVFDIVRLLLRQTLSMPISPFKMGRIQPILNDRSRDELLSIYGLEITTRFSVDAFPDVEGIGDFETFHGNWDIPVHGNVEKDIPSDDTADATDHVTLET